MELKTQCQAGFVCARPLKHFVNQPSKSLRDGARHTWQQVAYLFYRNCTHLVSFCSALANCFHALLEQHNAKYYIIL